MTKIKNTHTVESIVQLDHLSFAYADRPVFKGLSLGIPEHACCLVLGGNGIGKSTLLKVLAGKHMVQKGSCTVLGKDPFSDGLGLRDFSLVAEKLDLNLDIEVREVLAGLKRFDSDAHADLHTQEELLDLLEVDLNWRMHQVSNGQRRRVDLLLSLVNKAPKLLLLDEVTSDLDILSRQRLLRWLKKRVSEKKMSVIFATHILDGMLEWADHFVFLSPGFEGNLRMSVSMKKLQEQPLWAEALEKSPHHPLLWLCEQYLLEDRKRMKNVG